MRDEMNKEARYEKHLLYPLASLTLIMYFLTRAMTQSIRRSLLYISIWHCALVIQSHVYTRCEQGLTAGYEKLHALDKPPFESHQRKPLLIFVAQLLFHPTLLRV